MERTLLAAAMACLLASGSAYAAIPSPANVLQVSVASAAAVTSTTGVMAGLGASGTFTPHSDGVANLTISGDAVFGATGATGKIQIWYGPGAAPANGAAPIGAACGPTQAPVSLTGILTVGFSTNCIVTGLNLNTPYWFDLLIGSSTSTISVTNVSVSAAEE